MTQPSVLFLVPQSRGGFLFLTPFECAFMCNVHIWHLSEDTCWHTLVLRSSAQLLFFVFFAVLPINVHLGGSEESHWNPSPPMSPVLPRCVTGLRFQCLSAALQCFQIRLQLANVKQCITPVHLLADWRHQCLHVWSEEEIWAVPRGFVGELPLSGIFAWQQQQHNTGVHVCRTFRSDLSGSQLDRRRQHISVPPALKMTQDCALYLLTAIAFIIIDNK